MAETAPMTDRFVELMHSLIRLRPRLIFPDERIATLKQQLGSLRASSGANPGDRLFLFRILEILRGRENPPTMGELSAELGIPLSSATRLADGLVRAKFVERRGDPNDRRIVRLSLTGNGRRFTDTGMDLVRMRIGQLLQRFTAEEQAQLLRLLRKLIDSLEAEQN